MKFIYQLKYGGQIVMLFSLLVLTGFTSFEEWYLYDATSFSVEFPQKPESNIQSVPSSIGDIKMRVAMYDASNTKDDNLVYGAIDADYPDSLVNSDKPSLLPKFFRKSIDGAVKNVKGVLLSEKETELGGFPGREIRVDFNNSQAIIKMRLLLVHNKMIILQTITVPGKEGNNASLRFLNSLKLKG